MLKKLERMFLQLDAEYDSSIRIMAADILLRHRPSEQLLEDMFSGMAFQDTKELNTLLLGRIRDLASSDPHIERVSVLTFFRNLTMSALMTSPTVVTTIAVTNPVMNSR